VLLINGLEEISWNYFELVTELGIGYRVLVLRVA